MGAPRATRKLVKLVAAFAALSCFACETRAYDMNQELWQGVCAGELDTYLLRVEVYANAEQDLARHFALMTDLVRLKNDARATTYRYGINTYNVGAGTVRLSRVVLATGVAANVDCTFTKVLDAAAHNFVPVTEALATLNTSTAAVTTAVDALKSEVQGFRSDASSTFTDWNDFTGVDWVMVGYYFAAALSSVLGLWFVAMVCGQLIDLLRSAR